MSSAEIITKFLPTIELISKVKSKKSLEIILFEFSADKHFARLLAEIAHNIFKKKITVTRKTKTKLLKHKQTLVKVSTSNGRSRRRYIKQSGGWLQLALPALLYLFKEITG